MKANNVMRKRFNIGMKTKLVWASKLNETTCYFQRLPSVIGD